MWFKIEKAVRIATIVLCPNGVPTNINGLTVIIRRKSLALMVEGFLPIYSAPEIV